MAVNYRQKRSARNLTQAEMAEAVNISVGAWQGIETGRLNPSPQTFFRICSVLNRNEILDHDLYVWNPTRLKQLRKDNDLTQNELEKSIKASSKRICEWEFGVEPGLEYVMRLCKKFGVRPDYFYDRFDAETHNQKEICPTKAV